VNSEDIEKLEQQYRGYAEAHGAATLNGDYKSANKNYGKLIAVLAALRKAGSDGHSALARLSGDTNEAVACWAATHSLPFDEGTALSVLERLSERTGPMGFNAKMVVQQWKNGQLVIP
jgi:hypothetical protein